MAVLVAFGDSVLDCGHYNEHGVTPQDLLARNDDGLFPAFRGRDLWTARGGKVVDVVNAAQDGATVVDLPQQISSRPVPRGTIAMVSVGGNDLLQALVGVDEADLGAFPRRIRSALDSLKHSRLFVANVYDPSFGDDANNFLGVDPAAARRAHRWVNETVRDETERVGGCLVDLHSHFLKGKPSWFTRQIEPSLIGASEVRHAFLNAIVRTHADVDL